MDVCGVLGLALGQKQDIKRITGITVSPIAFLGFWVKDVNGKYGNEIWLNW